MNEQPARTVGFVACAQILVILVDAVRAHRLIMGAAFLGAGANGVIVLFAVGLAVALPLRVLTGVALAGVRSPGQMLMGR